MKTIANRLASPWHDLHSILFAEFLCLFLLCSGVVHAAQSGDFTYEARGTGGRWITITDYTGRGGSVAVPETIDGMAVAIIETYAFAYQSRLTAITLPSRVVTIGDRAFLGCDGLTSFTLPGSVTNIGERAFARCSRLTNITVDTHNLHFSDLDGVLHDGGQATLIRYPPGRTGSYRVAQSVSSIRNYAFEDCLGLTSLELPSSVKSIGLWPTLKSGGLVSLTVDSPAIGTVFSSLKTLRNVSIGDSLTSIPASAFSGCSEVTNITFGTNVTRIGDSSFAGCSNVTNFTLPIGLTNIGNNAFSGLSALRSLALPDGLTSLGKRAFSGCAQVTSLTLPNSLTNLNDYALSGLSRLRSIALPEGMKKVGSGAFQGCASLSSIVLPGNVMSISSDAFAGCGALMTVTVDPLNQAFSDRDGVLFNKAQNQLLSYPAGRVGNYVVPASVTIIGSRVFQGCTGLTAVTIPSSVTSVGTLAFSGCTGLVGVYFEGNAPAVGPDEFLADTKATVYYPAGATGWGATFGGRPTALWVPQPAYHDWAEASGLLGQYPNASGEQDDADRDGLTNGQERSAGTDPTSTRSTLAFESTARPGDLSEEDRSPLDSGEFALFFQSVPGRSYEIQSAETLDGVWIGMVSVTATSTQKRVRLAKPASPRFYRVATPGATALMVLIPGGAFMMGDAMGDGASYELPTHAVEVSSFYLDKDEVTQALWHEVKTWGEAHGYSFDNAGPVGWSNDPVQMVNWYDAVKWCNARSEKEGRVPAYYTGPAQAGIYRSGQVEVENGWVKWNNAGYRLPTEAEWEKAARGGMSGKRFPWGDTIAHNQANYYSSSANAYDVSSTFGYEPDYAIEPMPYTSPAGSFPPGADGYGLHDMAGNVAEWCWDWYGPYPSASTTDPRGPATGSYRVNRGGGWYSGASDCRVAARSDGWPDVTGDGLGFRTVLAPGP